MPASITLGLSQRGQMKTSQKAAAAKPKRKVRVNLWLDGDVVAYFKGRAALPSAAPYQTQINAALRMVMEGEGGDSHYAALVNDQRFIAAIADRLKRRR